MLDNPFFPRDPWEWYSSTPQGGVPWWLGPTDPLWGTLMPQPSPGGLEPSGFDPWTIIGGGSPQPPDSWRSALDSVSALVDEIPPDVRSQLDYIWDLTGSLRAILDLLAARQLLRGYYDPDTGQWTQPHYEVTATTTAPSGSTTTPPEKPEPRPEVGIIDWIWDPDAGQWVPSFSVTTYTSPPQETTTQTETTTETTTETVTSTEPGGTGGGWQYNPFQDIYIPYPPITFVVTATTTTPDVEYYTSPITTVLTPTNPPPWSPFIFTTTPATDTTATETTATETTTTDTTTTDVTPSPRGGVAGRVSGAGAPSPGSPAPVIGRPLGESVWQLAQYIPALVPHLGYFLAGR